MPSPGPSSGSRAVRSAALAISVFEYFGDEVERILRMNPVTGEVIDELNELWVYPATHYVTSKELLDRAIGGIEIELADRLAELAQDLGVP